MKKKIIKAVLGVMAAKKLLQNSQGARDIAGNLGIAPRLLADKYDKEEEEKQKQLKSQGMKHGGEAQGPKKVSLKAVYEYAKKNKGEDRLTQSDIKDAKEALYGKPKKAADYSGIKDYGELSKGGEAQGPKNNVNVMRGTGIAVRGTKFQGVF